MTDALIYNVASPKLPMILEGRNVVRLGGFNGGLEVSKNDLLPVQLNVSAIPIRLWFWPHPNANKSSFAIGLETAIHSVLGLCCLPHIYLSAIKTVPVYVVNAIFWKTHDKTMKRNYFSLNSFLPALRDACRRIKIAPTPPKMPTKAANHVRIFIVDYCRLALRQWDSNHFVMPSSGFYST